MQDQKPVQILRKEIDIPDGWRRGSVNRAPIDDPAAFTRGVQVLATHAVPDNYVCEITRVEAGVFAILAPAAVPQQVTQNDTLHWWSINSDAHAPVVLPPPLPAIDWHLHFVQTTGPFAWENYPPVDGFLFANPNALLELPFSGDVEHLWPVSRLGLLSFDAHKVVVGPRIVGLVATWEQPPAAPNPQALPYQLAQSWGLLEGRDLRFDSPEARRLLLGGLT